jgi:hypothetical protein
VAFGRSTGGDERSTLSSSTRAGRAARDRIPHAPARRLAPRQLGLATPATPAPPAPRTTRLLAAGLLAPPRRRLAPGRPALGRPPRQDGLAERVDVGRRAVAADPPLARVVARRRAPHRPPHRGAHRDDRGHRSEDGAGWPPPTRRRARGRPCGAGRYPSSDGSEIPGSWSGRTTTGRHPAC